MNTHSPEPWKHEHYESGCGFVKDANGNDVHQGYYDGEMPPENAQRIVACVNACQGIPTETLLRVSHAATRSNEQFVCVLLQGGPKE